ncbi:molybdopterin-dependent oxidoreductase [Paenibacillus crassostreae]|uniref:Oxidoreductase n=1 Tax=Paenibacillus crassostreae TaxID=1763538 RepID=A0A167E1T4_9BACL|nr:molybdopterin-dependent oxidoreductase [Paenibacillus crassostreae]AOZ93324.1 oxidoreductase [Paenibacillus crassostreae]OAB75031.1 oxidoreductase [Paenibacillus crassostreae]
MKNWLSRITKSYGRKLTFIHYWNAWIVVVLALSGLILLGSFWREVLGEGRVWLKWLHVGVGLVLLIPIGYYFLLIKKHWKQLRGKPWQKFNVVFVLILLVGWIGSGIILWQIRLFSPLWANSALLIHDLLTWIGLPYIIYHSLTRTAWLKHPERLSITKEKKHQHQTPGSFQPLYTRREFIRSAIGIGIAVTVGPSFIKWIGNGLTAGINKAALISTDSNNLVPAPTPAESSLPPIGGGARGDFRVYSVTPIPSFDNSNWSFTIDGLVDRPNIWNWEQFVMFGRTVQVSDFHCVTGWSVYNNTWEGIPLKTFLQEAGVKSEATTVKLYSGDGIYTDSLTLKQAQMDDVLVAVLHDGEVIPADLGGPARLIVPRMFAYKSVKWLNRIELIQGEHTGYWEDRGYDKDAWVTKTNKMDY